MRRQVLVYQPGKAEAVGGIFRQSYELPVYVWLSIQPAGDGKGFKNFLTGRKTEDYYKAIGEFEMTVSEEGKTLGSMVYVDNQYYEVVARQIWKNGVNNHFTYLLFGITDRAAKSKISG